MRAVLLPSLEELRAQAASSGETIDLLIDAKIREVDAALSLLPGRDLRAVTLRRYLLQLPRWAMMVSAP